MNAKLVSSVVCCLGLLFVLAAFGVSAPATVITTGDVHLGGGCNPTQPDYCGLYVGYNGNGTLNVEAGGEVSNGPGVIARGSGSTGTVTVTGVGSKCKIRQRA